MLSTRCRSVPSCVPVSGRLAGNWPVHPLRARGWRMRAVPHGMVIRACPMADGSTHAKRPGAIGWGRRLAGRIWRRSHSARRGAPDHDPTNRRQWNLRSLYQRCHLAHDRAWHAAAALDHVPVSLRLRRPVSGPYRHGRSAALPLSNPGPDQPAISTRQPDLSANGNAAKGARKARHSSCCRS